MKFTHYFRDPQSGHIFGTDNAAFWSDYEKLTRAEGQRLYREQSATRLRELLKPGQTVYTCLRSRSSSGMSRRISVHVAIMAERYGAPDKRRANGYRMIRVPVIHDITADVGEVIGERMKDGALLIGGCGMDMGFDVVYRLGAHLWPHGTKKPHGKRNGEPDRDGGYALKHEWV